MISLHAYQRQQQRQCRCQYMFLIYFLLFISISVLQKQYSQNFLFVEGTVTCSTNNECESILRPGSECRNGQCTNPFHNGGCLKNYFSNEKEEDWSHKKTRICHSDDPPEAAEKGYCNATSPFNYMEIRISSQNWESVFFQAWILQIILSELLDVPVSIETGVANANVDFYNIDSSFDYGTSNDLDHLKVGAEIGDCRKLKATNTEENYKPCSHFIPEVWPSGYPDVYPEYIENGSIEPLATNGGVSEQYFFVPKFTAERDPSVLSYIGLRGEQNRFKLAKMFRQPTTWKEYCTEVSPNNCTIDDGIASRAPIDEIEETRMFAGEGKYIGHFRITDKNDCSKFPHNCTGFFADYPCFWHAYAPQQLYHNDIALDSGYTSVENSYSYTQLTEIWAAANATKSDVIILWWKPESLYQTYLGTDAEMTKVTLPPPTQTCIENRAPQEHRCTPNSNELKFGKKEGSCDYIPEIVAKVIGGGLYELAHNPELPEALHSPAYDVLKNIQITDLQIGTIMDYWLARGKDKWNFDPRDATCKWVVENLDLVKSFIPESYPRVMKEMNVFTSTAEANSNSTSDKSSSTTSRSKHAIALGSARIVAGLSIFCVAISFLLVYKKRKTKVINYTQIEYIFILLFGWLLISMGACIMVLPPTDTTCITVVWMVSLGYSFALVPLLIKIFVVNRLVNTGKHMKRVRLRRRRLLGQVIGVCNIICAFLIIWMVIDPRKSLSNYELFLPTNKATPDTGADGETVVMAYHYCSSSKYNFWPLIDLAWQAGVLFSSCVLVFLVRKVDEDINNTRELALLVYTQLIFVIFRAINHSLDNTMENWKATGSIVCDSLLHSIECIVAIIIFISPKVCSNNKTDQEIDAAIARYDQGGADLFVDTTIIFADISGFSAWCSIRSPVDVFKFLDKVYYSFDEIAERRRVFKVETVGDCYVGATGLPQPSADHAVAMAKFAMDCMNKMHMLSTELEVVFGPDTADLTLRIGIHSGPVTGGFLRGKRAHFQLFGDTMNMAEWIESTGKAGHIHVSQATANFLIKAGKKKWIHKRVDALETKGCGTLQTYWLEHTKSKNRNKKKSTTDLGDNDHDDNSSTSGFAGTDGIGIPETAISSEKDFGFSPEKTNRLVKWNVEVLRQLLVQIIARRNALSSSYNSAPSKSIEFLNQSICETGTIPLEEVKEIITLPRFDKKTIRRVRDTDTVEIPANVMNQLKEYVSAVAGMYRENYFHNFEHASHVVMAVTKYMSRIIAPANIDRGEDEHRLRSKIASTLHDHTYGITSDPLTQFACVFSALIHDLDHPGVPNPQLIKEDKQLADFYKQRSVAEQNSFDLAWQLLMEKRFKDLRAAIFCDDTEFYRFRQLVVNSVMATDIGDKELKVLRNSRWDKAFHLKEASQQVLENPRDDVNRKATIVIEHLIQAADVSHTMQHWDVYRKWNEQLFHECYEAYRSGRSENNPADGWYKGEIGFFDFYIIPLAKKLDTCGVFGVTSHENLDYAQRNRSEWEANGAAIVAEMIRKVEGADMARIEEYVEDG